MILKKSRGSLFKHNFFHSWKFSVPFTLSQDDDEFSNDENQCEEARKIQQEVKI